MSDVLLHNENNIGIDVYVGIIPVTIDSVLAIVVVHMAVKDLYKQLLTGLPQVD